MWIDSFLDPETMGETRFDPKQIILKKGYSDKETVHTYLHECLHALSHEFDIGLTEEQVKSFEKGLYYILKSNNLFKGVANGKKSRKRKTTRRIH